MTPAEWDRLANKLQDVARDDPVVHDALVLLRMPGAATISLEDGLVMLVKTLVSAKDAALREAKKHAQRAVVPSLEEPCPHPARNGRHETYVTAHSQDGRHPAVCRACGARGTL